MSKVEVLAAWGALQSLWSNLGLGCVDQSYLLALLGTFGGGRVFNLVLQVIEVRFLALVLSGNTNNILFLSL